MTQIISFYGTIKKDGDDVMVKEDVLKVIGDYVMSCKDNYVSKEMAIDLSDVGKNMYDRPIIAIGSAEDPLWEVSGKHSL